MTQSKSTIVTLGVLVGILLLGALTVVYVSHRQSQLMLQNSDAAAVLRNDTTQPSYSDLEGNVIDLEQYVGQAIIVTSWASWSPFSASELTLLAEAVAQYDEEDIVVIAVNRAESKSTAESFLQTVGVNQVVTLVMDPADTYYKRIGGYTMPETIVYDRTGAVVAHKRGRLNDTELSAYIEQALE